MAHKITIRLSQKGQQAAVLAGQPAAAIQTFEVPGELVADLLALGAEVDSVGDVTLDAERILARAQARALLDVPVTTAVAAIAQVRSMLAEWEEEKEEARRQLAIDLEEWTKRPLDVLVPNGNTWVPPVSMDRVCQVHGCASVSLPEGHPVKDMVFARLEEARALAAARLAVEREEQSKRQKDDLEKIALRKAEEKALEESWSAWATARGGLLAEGVEAGYAMHNAILDCAIGQIAAGYEAKVLCHGSGEYRAHNWELRDSPTADALRLEKSLAALIKKASLPPSLTIYDPEVCRVTVTDEEYGEDTKYTAVVVTLESPLTKTRTLIFRCE